MLKDWLGIEIFLRNLKEERIWVKEGKVIFNKEILFSLFGGRKCFWENDNKGGILRMSKI